VKHKFKIILTLFVASITTMPNQCFCMKKNPDEKKMFELYYDARCFARYGGHEELEKLLPHFEFSEDSIGLNKLMMIALENYQNDCVKVINNHMHHLEGKVSS